MNIAAVICVRDDHQYLEGCLSHLIRNGVSYAIIDNGLSDESLELLARPHIRKNLVAFARLPFTGVSDLERRLEMKEEVIGGLGADWIIHLDADEVMESYREGESLADAIARIDSEGWNVVNFEEYVFLPVDQPYRPGPEPQPLCCYYPFALTGAPRLMRARKKSAALSMLSPPGVSVGAGHLLFGPEVKIAPEWFALRHYIVRDQDHAYAKYTTRTFAPAALAKGWHSNRVGFPAQAFTFPAAGALRRLPHPLSRAFDRSEPKTTHYWQWA